MSEEALPDTIFSMQYNDDDALTVCARCGDLEAAAPLLEKERRNYLREADRGGGCDPKLWLLEPMLAACRSGHLNMVMLLSSYKASRGKPTAWAGRRTLDASGHVRWMNVFPYGSEAESAARDCGHAEVAAWLTMSTSWTPLQVTAASSSPPSPPSIAFPPPSPTYSISSPRTPLLLSPSLHARYTPSQHMQVLSANRTINLLRSDMAGSPRRGVPSPLQLAVLHPRCPASELILRACAPWSPTTHTLWPAPKRARAIELCRVGQLLARRKLHPAEEGSFFDAWLWFVMPNAVTHE